MRRQRMNTHIGFGGHYHIVNHIGHVQVDDEPHHPDDSSVDSDLTNDDLSETSITDKVADFETARKIEETLARFPEARKRAEKAYVSKRSFNSHKSNPTENTPHNLFGRNDNFAQALSSVLKLCVEENANDKIDPSVSAASHPGTGTTVLPTLQQIVANATPAATSKTTTTMIGGGEAEGTESLSSDLEKLRHITIKVKNDEKHGRVRIKDVDVAKILSSARNGQPSITGDNRSLTSTPMFLESRPNRPKSAQSSFATTKRNSPRPSSSVRKLSISSQSTAQNKIIMHGEASTTVNTMITSSEQSPSIISTKGSQSTRRAVKFLDHELLKELDEKFNTDRFPSAAIPNNMKDNDKISPVQNEEEEFPVDVDEGEEIICTRNKMKQLSSKLQTYKVHNKPLTFALKEELNIQHANMSEIMQHLLDKSCNRLSDEKRLYLEESVLVVNGFNALDADSDGLLSRSDFELFFKKRKGKPPIGEIDRIMWLLDDNRRGYLALQDVQNYYLRVLHMFQHWTPIAEMEKHHNIVSLDKPSTTVSPGFSFSQRPTSASPRKIKTMMQQSKSKIASPTEDGVASSNQKANKIVDVVHDNSRYSLAVLRNAMECFTESIFLYRLILFAALENGDREVHVLSALQQMVERFGPEVADRKFEQLFCRSAVDLQDSEVLTLTEVLGNAKRWDKRFERFKVPLSAREKADIYIQYRNTELEKQMKLKMEQDELQQLDLLL